MQKVVVVLMALFAAIFPLNAQSNAVIDALLDADPAAFSDAAYLVLSAAKVLTEKATPKDTVWALQARDWGIAARPAKEPITVGEYASLLMQAFEVRGGILYRLFPGPRYACRELAFLGLLEGSTATGRRLSGGEAVRILSRFLERRGIAP